MADIDKATARLGADLAGTSADIARVEAGLKADTAGLDTKIDRLEGKIETEIRDLDRRMTIKPGGMMMVSVGAVAALVTLL